MGKKKCPWCKKGSVIRRVRRFDGLKFFGCSLFPRCYYTPEADRRFAPWIYSGRFLPQVLDWNDELRPY